MSPPIDPAPAPSMSPAIAPATATSMSPAIAPAPATSMSPAIPATLLPSFLYLLFPYVVGGELFSYLRKAGR